jgi:hypothetical protein
MGNNQVESINIGFRYRRLRIAFFLFFRNTADSGVPTLKFGAFTTTKFFKEQIVIGLPKYNLALCSFTKIK